MNEATAFLTMRCVTLPGAEILDAKGYDKVLNDEIASYFEMSSPHRQVAPKTETDADTDTATNSFAIEIVRVVEQYILTPGGNYGTDFRLKAVADDDDDDDVQLQEAMVKFEVKIRHLFISQETCAEKSRQDEEGVYSERAIAQGCDRHLKRLMKDRNPYWYDAFPSDCNVMIFDPQIYPMSLPCPVPAPA
ncbi:MAG: hypothetical protein ACYCOU_02910 [Sulfobacillus sp.]